MSLKASIRPKTKQMVMDDADGVGDGICVERESAKGRRPPRRNGSFEITDETCVLLAPHDCWSLESQKSPVVYPHIDYFRSTTVVVVSLPTTTTTK